MRFFYSLFLAFVIIFSASGQEIVLEKNVDEQYKGTHGPNMRHYGHLYIGGGIIPDFDEETGSEIKFWRSGQFLIGYRYKLKMLNFYAVGADLNYRYTKYFIDDDEANPFDPNNPLTFFEGEKKHFLENHGIGLELYQRINIGKRGNSLGFYIDTGFRGQWNISDIEKAVFIIDDEASPAGKSRIKNRRLRYTEPFSYGPSARIGYNKFSLYGYYRLSDYFDTGDFSIPELPRLTVGLQFGL